jgi:hypothetical protein
MGKGLGRPFSPSLPIYKRKGILLQGKIYSGLLVGGLCSNQLSVTGLSKIHFSFCQLLF